MNKMQLSFIDQIKSSYYYTKLTAWEKDFIKYIDSSEKDLTDNQNKKLNEIQKKIAGFE